MIKIIDLDNLKENKLYMFHPDWTDECGFFEDDEAKEKVKSILQCKGYVYKEKEENRKFVVNYTEDSGQYDVYWFAEQDLVKKKETNYIPVIFKNGKGVISFNSNGSLTLQYSDKSEVVFDPDGLHMFVEITEFPTEKCLPPEMSREVNDYLGLETNIQSIIENKKSGGKRKRKRNRISKKRKSRRTKKSKSKKRKRRKCKRNSKKKIK